MLIIRDKQFYIIIQFTICSLPSYQPFQSHHLVWSHKLQVIMMVTSAILCAHKLSSDQYLYDTMQYCDCAVVSCYSLNSTVSSHLSYVFSYFPLYAVVIGVSVSVGIVLLAVVGVGAVTTIILKQRTKKKRKRNKGTRR